jgi:hypothetical protein
MRWWIAVEVAGMCVIGSWPVLYAHYEWYWWGLPLGLVILFGGVVASGPSDTP